jgi:hypothetical protein
MRRSSLVVSLVVGALLVPVAVLASHQFNDVPDSHIFHTGISWMKDNNITVGCNPPANTNYCPDDNVTRGQMATFMKRLAENQVVDAASAANADALDGLSAAQLGSRAAFNSSTDLPDEGTTLAATIEAPTRGVLVMNGAVDVTTGSVADTVVCVLAVDGSPLDGTYMFVEVAPSPRGPVAGICATTGAIAVDPGSHTVAFRIDSVTDALLFSSSVNAIWVPFDGSGSTPASITPLGTSEVEEKPADD